MYRSAIIGTGGRGRDHANAYRHVQGIELVAACDIDSKRVHQFARDFNLPGAYENYQHMLREHRPHIVHLTTNPDVRVEAVQACAGQGVKGLIIEKPLALSLDQAHQIQAIGRETGMKIVVNTQRRFFPSWIDLCKLVRSGECGPIHWIRIHSLAAVFCTGSHIVDLIQMLLGDVDPVQVWSSAYGAHEYHSSHPGPSSFLTSITYPNRVHLLWEASQDGPGLIGEDNFWMSLEINIHTAKGHVWWTEAKGWGYQIEGMAQPRCGHASFYQDDPLAQAAFTQALGRWLDDPAQPHPNRLDHALRVFAILAAMVHSASLGRRIDYDPAALRDSATQLRGKLEAAEGIHPEKQKWAWNPPPLTKPQ